MVLSVNLNEVSCLVHKSVNTKSMSTKSIAPTIFNNESANFTLAHISNDFPYSVVHTIKPEDFPRTIIYDNILKLLTIKFHRLKRNIR